MTDEAAESRAEMIQDQIDPYLALLVGVTNTSETDDPSGMLLTLSIGGSLMSGELISSTGYFKTLAQLYEDEGMKSAWENIAKQVKEFIEDELVDGSHRPVHFHLKDVQVVLNNGHLPIKQAVFRGRLDRVDGWSPGALGYTVSRS